MALDPQQHNQLEAVRVLAELPDSQEVDHLIAELLDSDRADVRIEAYRLLIANSALPVDASDCGRLQSRRQPPYGILTHNHQSPFSFWISVQSSGPPMVYATSSGVPRIAIIGHHLALHTPLTFTAMDMRLSITSSDGTNLLTVFYRDPTARDRRNRKSHNDLPEILARLGGKGPEDARQSFDLSLAT